MLQAFPKVLPRWLAVPGPHSGLPRASMGPVHHHRTQLCSTVTSGPIPDPRPYPQSRSQGQTLLAPTAAAQPHRHSGHAWTGAASEGAGGGSGSQGSSWSGPAGWGTQCSSRKRAVRARGDRGPARQRKTSSLRSLPCLLGHSALWGPALWSSPPEMGTWRACIPS